MVVEEEIINRIDELVSKGYQVKGIDIIGNKHRV